MGNPAITELKKFVSLYKCKACGNTDEFLEEWLVEIIQNAKNKTQTVELVESENIRCKKCGSFDLVDAEAENISKFE